MNKIPIKRIRPSSPDQNTYLHREIVTPVALETTPGGIIHEMYKIKES